MSRNNGDRSRSDRQHKEKLRKRIVIQKLRTELQAKAAGKKTA